MKNQALLSLLSLLGAAALASPAHAGLSRSVITNMTITLYGMYTTSDASCQTGLIPTIPLSATATDYNLATAPTLGAGLVANPIRCVVFVARDQITQGWNAGNYTGTTNGHSDSVCNAGGSIDQKICRSVGSLSFPAQIVSDAAALGLTLASSCAASPTGNEIIPIYISTNAACTGSSTDATAGCVAGGNPTNSAFAAPTSADDTANGIKLSASTLSGTVYFAVDPDQTLGGGNTACESSSPPLFSLHN